MPRPCQKRRASAAAQRNAKPAAPPPIRHKKRQKSIHNARRKHPSAQNAGGRPSRNQRSGNAAEDGFVAFSNRGNNFHMLNGAGTRHDPYTLDSNPDMDLEDGELPVDQASESDSDDVADSDMNDAGDMMINVQVTHTSTARGKANARRVMFTLPEAMRIYNDLRRAGFPLQIPRVKRYGPDVGIFTDTEPDRSLAPPSSTRQLGMDGAVSVAPHATVDVNAAGRDYVWTWGKFSGQPFSSASQDYLRTIGGQLDILESKHPGLRAAFDYHMPGKARHARQKPNPQASKPSAQPMRHQQPESTHQTRSRAQQPQNSQQSRQPQPGARPAFPRSSAQPSSDTYRFTKGQFKGKKLSEVPDNYLRSLERTPIVMETWPRLAPALQDFNRRTGRLGRA